MELSMSPDVAKLNPDLLTTMDKGMSPSKYHNARAEAAGMTFQSGRAAAGVSKLLLLEQMKEITGLRLQTRFLLPGNIEYVADATYLAKDGAHVIDFKGYKTPAYRMKKKLFEETYPYRIEEC